MPSLTSAYFAEPHFACLDMVRIDCAPAPGQPASEYAILLEVSAHRATVQTSFPVAAGSPIGITVGQREIAAEVRWCEADQGFGYLLDLEITPAQPWFPGDYMPAWRSSEPAESTIAPFVC